MNTFTGDRSPRPRQLGLRARVMVAFALGALALSAVLSVLTYGLVRNYLLEQREDAVTRQAFLNAKLVRDSLRAPEPDPGSIVTTAIEAPTGSLLVYRGEPYINSVIVGEEAVPSSLRETVDEGIPARQRFRLGGRPYLAIGVPIPRVDAQYYEAFSLADVDRTLEVLGFSLAGAALLTTLAGAAVGRWASARVLRPLTGVSDAAAAIAGGQLDIRLAAADDKDLAPLADSFNQMVDALSQRIERDARFASDVSHELRSPLTTLSTSLQVLEARRDQMPARARAALDLLSADVGRFQRMVEDLLEISRFDAGVADLHLEPVDPGQLVRFAVSMAGADLPVEVAPSAEEVRVAADKRRMVRVVTNLIENAAAYGEGATRVAVEGGAAFVRIAVEDKGPGVPSEERQLIFDRFFRGSESGRRGAGEGSGLGLALVREHVALHGGRVWVEDAPGGGARFVIELPVAP